MRVYGLKATEKFMNAMRSNTQLELLGEKFCVTKIEYFSNPKFEADGYSIVGLVHVREIEAAK